MVNISARSRPEITRADADTVAFFQDIVVKARAGELPLEILAELLEILLAAENHPVAAMLYREWSAHRRTEILCPAEIHARLAAALERLGRHEPGLPALPPADGPPDQTQYVLHGDPAKTPLATALHRAFFQALALDHKLPPSIVALRGMSRMKYRYLINRLVEGLPGVRYLEVGSWMGSTVCAAAFGNAVDALCIDNWSEFGGPRDQFLANIAALTGPSTRIDHLEQDFRKVDFASIGRFDIYLFDGPHSEQDHVDGIVRALPALKDEFVLIVDDWNWEPVRAGTTRALRDSGIESLFGIEIRTTQNGRAPRGPQFETSEWHNGYFIAVCRKPARA